MANTKDIKSHIKSIKDTQKVTNAMYLISSTKLRSVRAINDNAGDYYKQSEEEFSRIYSSDIDNPFVKKNNTERKAFLIIASDKGLAGDFNKAIMYLALSESDENTDFFIIGNTVKKYFVAHKIKFVEDFDIHIKNPDYEIATEISNIFKEKYSNGEYNSIRIYYTDFGDGIHKKTTSIQLLPVETENGNAPTDFEYIPSKEDILSVLIPAHITGVIHRTIISSLCSEHNARMVAMDAANQNAKKLLDELNLQYNRMRQNAITQEITEISGGRKEI